MGEILRGSLEICIKVLSRVITACTWKYIRHVRYTVFHRPPPTLEVRSCRVKERAEIRRISKGFEMREIVHIQAGQCGNQIGAKVKFHVKYIFFFSSRNSFDRLMGILWLKPSIYFRIDFKVKLAQFFVNAVPNFVVHIIQQQRVYKSRHK